MMYEVEVDLQIHTFLTSTLDVCECSTSRLQKRAPDARQIGVSVSPRVCLDFLEEDKTSSLPTIGSRSFCHGARRPINTGVS